MRDTPKERQCGRLVNDKRQIKQSVYLSVTFPKLPLFISINYYTFPLVCLSPPSLGFWIPPRGFQIIGFQAVDSQIP